MRDHRSRAVQSAVCCVALTVSCHGTRHTRADAPSELKAKAALEKKLGGVYSALRELELKDVFALLTKLNFGIHGPVVWE